MTYTLRRMLPNATTCEVTWDNYVTYPTLADLETLLDLLDGTERRIKERMNGPQASNG
jgi:hypothetical protein